MPEYIKWDAPGVEVIAEGEEELKRVIAEQFNGLQRLNFDRIQHGMRATHLKTQGCIKGTLTIHDALPPHLAQGMFSKPRKHDVVLRYSSLPPRIFPDPAVAPRGLAFKTFDVEGEKLFGNPTTQDFTFNNYPILELRDLKGSNKLADALNRHYDDLSKLADEDDSRPDLKVKASPVVIPNQAHFVAMRQYSQGAYRYGDYVAKFGVFPQSEDQKKLETVELKESDPIDILAKNLREYHAKNKVTYSFCVQLLENLDDQPVEDTGVEWSEEKYPFQQVATLEFEPQESFDNAFRTWFDDTGVQCNPWHGLKVHQPLGSAQRVRRNVYAESRKLRLRMNGLTDYREPTNVNEVPIGARQVSTTA